MGQIYLTDSTVDALLEIYDWYLSLIGEKSSDYFNVKIHCAVDIALASLYADCLQLEAKKKKDEERHRDFATTVYAESAPENWKDIIEKWNIKHYISPLHSKEKKPHWHIMLCFDTMKTDKDVRELISQINGVELVHVLSRRAMMSYMSQSEGGD